MKQPELEKFQDLPERTVLEKKNKNGKIEKYPGPYNILVPKIKRMSSIVNQNDGDSRSIIDSQEELSESEQKYFKDYDQFEE